MTAKSKKSNKRCHCGDTFTDYQKGRMWIRVCKDLPLDFELNGNRYCIFHFPRTEKAQEFKEAFDNKLALQDYFFLGTWFPSSIILSGYTFQTWANFAWATFSDEVTFEGAQFLEGCKFLCSTFKKQASFVGASFSPNIHKGAETNFYSVTFEDLVDFGGASFQTIANFSQSKFLGNPSEFTPSVVFSSLSSFSGARFLDEAHFDEVVFGDIRKSEVGGSVIFTSAYFEKLAEFKGAHFTIHTAFNAALFKKTADFRETEVRTSVTFEGASFEGFAKFSGKDRKHRSWAKRSFNFKSVDVERAEKISFQTLELDPEAFLNTDVRKFAFADVNWKIKNFAFDWSRSKDICFWTESAQQAKSNYELLEVAYRRVAANAEDSNQYRYASKLRYAAFEIQRINRWYGRLPITLLWWYKWTSRYGENWLWTAIVLAAVLALSAYAYTQVDFYVCPVDRPVAQSISAGLCTTRQLDRYEAARHSLAMATFQNVDYRRPTTGNGEMFVLLEKILAPVQAALLALAIRRKVMR